MNKKEYKKPTIKIAKISIVLLLIAITFANTYLKFNGDNWILEIIFLIAQLYYSIYGGFYTYLFNKPMTGRFSSIEYIPGNPENQSIRLWWLLAHIGIYILIQFR